MWKLQFTNEAASHRTTIFLATAGVFEDVMFNHFLFSRHIKPIRALIPVTWKLQKDCDFNTLLTSEIDIYSCCSFFLEIKFIS